MELGEKLKDTMNECRGKAGTEQVNNIDPCTDSELFSDN
jgi:hypothetical protein